MKRVLFDIKLYFFVIFIVLLTAKACFSQALAGDFRYEDIRFVANTDSLEKALVPTPNHNRLKQLLSLEKSWCYGYRNRFGGRFKEIWQLTQKLKSKTGQAHYYLYLADDEFNKERFLDAHQHGLKSYDIFESRKDTVGMAAALFIITKTNLTIYGKLQGDSLLTNVRLKKLQDLANSSGHPEALLFSWWLLGALHNGKQEADKMLLVASKGKILIHENPYYNYFKTFFLIIEATAYLHLKKFPLAIKKYEETIRFCNRYNVGYSTLSSCYYNRGYVYGNMGQPRKAIESYKSAMNLIRSEGYAQEIMAACYNNTSLALEDIGDYKNAVRYKDTCLIYERNLYNVRRIKDLNEFQVKYEVEKKESQNKILQQEKQIAETRNKQYVAWMTGGVLFATIVTGLAFLLYRSNRRHESLRRFRNSIFSIIAHDLRSPLTAFQGISEQVTYLLRKGQYERLKAISTHMDESITSLLLLVNNLLEWSLSQTPRLVKYSEEVSINELWEETCELYQIIAQNRQVEIQIDFTHQLKVKGDKNALAVVFRNLLDNALKHTQNGKIEISAATGMDTVEISIADTGKGLSSNIVEELRKLFKEEYFINLGRKTGIGMSLINYLVRQHEGKISFQTSTHGTTFFITLPTPK